jgi:DUF438 domain-containing protein
MERTIQFKKSVYEICTEYPEVKDILSRLGFADITKPEILNTVGRLVTIPKGASVRGIALSGVIEALQSAGFSVEGAPVEQSAPAAPGRDDRTALLREYVGRLSRGDDLEAVRKDFVAHFESVDAAEIARAEQELIQSGTPVAEVQRLCDVHSALFHGATREEQIANAEKAVQASADAAAKSAGTALSRIAGHPIAVLSAENDVISDLIAETRQCAAGPDGRALAEKLNALHAAAVHYAEKGDLLYPVLKSRYQVSGPADVMWGVDVEMKNELKILSNAGAALPNFQDRLGKLLTRAEEMIYKERNILFPLCAQNFTEEDWMRIYYELPNYDCILPSGRPVWPAAEKRREALSSRAHGAAAGEDGLIRLNSGHMTAHQIEAVFNTIPLEISFIDDQNRNCFFNAGSEKKLFKRPDEAVDREVFDCHPPKYAAMARQIIQNLRSGARDSVDVWLNKRGEPVLVRYMAVRDRNGEYVGTLECVQKMGFARDHFKGAAEK